MHSIQNYSSFKGSVLFLSGTYPIRTFKLFRSTLCLYGGLEMKISEVRGDVLEQDNNN